MISTSYIIGIAAAVVACTLTRFLVKRCVFALDKDQQLLVQRLTKTEVINGPGLQFISPFVKSATLRNAELLQPLDYILVKDTLSGTLGVVSGPALHFLAPFDRILHRGQAFSLSAQEYLTVKDTQSGTKRIVKGPRVFVPGAYEECSGKTVAISLE